MAKHLVHHSHKEKQKLCTRQNNTLENPRNTYLCNGYMKKNKQMRALVTIVRPTVCTPPKLSIEAHESERGTIMLLFIVLTVLHRLVNPVNQKLNLQTSVNGFSFFYLTP